MPRKFSRRGFLGTSLAALPGLARERAEKTEVFLKSHNLSGLEQARDAAIRFCLDNPDVHCVCPSINTFGQLDAFLAISGPYGVPIQGKLIVAHETLTLAG